MGFFCGSRIYFIKYTTIGHRDDGIGFICIGFTWYTTIGHGDDGIGFLCWRNGFAEGKGKLGAGASLCWIRRGDDSGRHRADVIDFLD